MVLLELNSFADWLRAAWHLVKDFFNQPVPIIGCTVGFALVFILKIISTTSIGQKGLKKIKDELSIFKTDFEGKEQEIKVERDKFITEINALVKEHEEEIARYKELLNQVDTKYKELLDQADTKYNELKDLVMNIASNLHNKKIKDILESLKGVDENGEEQELDSQEEE